MWIDREDITPEMTARLDQQFAAASEAVRTINHQILTHIQSGTCESGPYCVGSEAADTIEQLRTQRPELFVFAFITMAMAIVGTSIGLALNMDKTVAEVVNAGQKLKDPDDA